MSIPIMSMHLVDAYPPNTLVLNPGSNLPLDQLAPALALGLDVVNRAPLCHTNLGRIQCWLIQLLVQSLNGLSIPQTAVNVLPESPDKVLSGWWYLGASQKIAELVSHLPPLQQQGPSFLWLEVNLILYDEPLQDLENPFASWHCGWFCYHQALMWGCWTPNFVWGLLHVHGQGKESQWNGTSSDYPFCFQPESLIWGYS